MSFNLRSSTRPTLTKKLGSGVHSTQERVREEVVRHAIVRRPFSRITKIIGMDSEVGSEHRGRGFSTVGAVAEEDVFDAIFCNTL